MDYSALFGPLIGHENVLTEAQVLKSHGKDSSPSFEGAPGCVLFPKSREDVQKILRACTAQKIAVVPSGGRTGLSGAATATNGEVVVSLEKMNKILEVNSIERTLRCEAGAVTQKIQETAAEHGLYYPVDFASKGSSHIGGNIATNAGGIRVIRYGNTRDWVLGIVAVTASGEILELNGSLFKNQTGYDLKSLIIGSEGTLAVIVEATMRVCAPPGDTVRITCGLGDVAGTIDILQRTRREFPLVSVFEYFERAALDKVIAATGLKDPLTASHPHYLLIEIEYRDVTERERIDEFFMGLIEGGNISDAAMSQGSKQATEFLAMREHISESLTKSTVVHKNDISVPVSSIPSFVKELNQLVKERYPNFQSVTFGHVGDGNLHLNILKPADVAKEAFKKTCKESDEHIFTLVKKYRGSISAEHGVGLLKRGYLHYSRSGAEISLMKELKRVFDPNGILNPGKIFE